ncbi:hypothetical protein SAMN04488688_10618 [Paenibacillus sp. cl141a]|uniref:hypothetical protein n=1 Tax=Paenibacillus sp. cl141a TaxID=1761877 RepID=UPI0008CC049C|nr:hypothetical protein [Paenibacillus sp. cl141a]SEL80919.1 hypothetical protein SAMN04488688_10618 [Paenibacillus sp. cl141a]
MPGVALNNAPIQQVNKSSHVSYVERYVYDRECTDYDQFGNCTGWNPLYTTTTHYTNAKITGSVSSSHNVLVNGVSVVTVGDATQEQWIADPSPSPKLDGIIISINPGTSDSGSGKVFNGSSNVFVNGKALASIGSTITTHLAVPSSITRGSNNVFVN